jgi:murein DD-endopeptidase MepM/ murein hydrolase activator NlpD
VRLLSRAHSGRPVIPVVPLLALLALTTVGAQQPTDRGRQLTQRLYGSECQALWQDMTEAARAVARSREHFADFCKAVQNAGSEAKVLGESATHENGLEHYSRIVLLGTSLEPFEVAFAIDASGKIADVFVRPTTPAADVRYATKTNLRLPFAGPWYVAAGGRTLKQNHHVAGWDIRFAYDFIAVEDAESKPRLKNSDYAGWGRQILAPADGIIRVAVDSRPDNEPGVPNVTDIYGNHVVIDHQNGEYSFLLHLQQGSVRVRVGQTVHRGDVLGLCGNSGDSSGPHLHYHLQDRVGSDGKGLPAQFHDYLTAGKVTTVGEPTQGLVIANSR